MTSVTVRRIALLVALAVVGTRPTLAQFADSLEAIPMDGRVYMLKGAGDVITASVGPDGVLLVDDGFPQTTSKVRSALEALGGGEPRYIINTHWHHAGANADFAGSATILAHRRTRERLREGAVMYVREMPPAPPEALPDVVFDDSLSLYFNGEEIKIWYLPEAHTDTDVAVWFTESGVVALGDVFVTMIPVTDYASGGDLYRSLETVDHLLTVLPEDVKIVPGHGEPADYDDLRRFRDMLAGMIAYVEGKVARGRTAEELTEAGIPDEWQDWMSDLLQPEFVLGNLFEGVVRRTRQEPSSSDLH